MLPPTAAHPRFDAVFFDFGGVMTTSPFDAFADYERSAGLEEGAIRRINSTDPDDNAWARLERSEVSLEEFVEAFEAEGRLLGLEVDGTAVLACLAGRLRPEMVRAVRAAAARFATALLTNNVLSAPAVGAGSSPHAEVIEFFDVIVESSVIGIRKPEPRFYELACELVGVEPARVVFLDDLGINLKPARAMGMTTIKVVDPGEALAQLDALLGPGPGELSGTGRDRGA